LALAPEECHESVCHSVRVDRKILEAWREEFGDDDDAPDDAPPGESPTRVA